MASLLLILAALFHAIWNSMIKGSDNRLLALGAIRAVGLILGISIISSHPLPPLAVFPYLFGAAGILLFYFFFLLTAYRLGDFSQVYPIARGAAPLIVFALGALILREALSWAEILAILLISAGIISLSFAKGTYSIKPVLFAIGTAISVAGYTFISGLGVRLSSSFLVFAGWLETITGICVISYIIFTRKLDRQYIRNHWQNGLIAGILSAAGYATALWAMTRLPLATVAALRETSIIFAALIGSLFLKEGMSVKRITAACIVVVGVAILAIH